MSAKDTAATATRKLLNSFNFDPTDYLGTQIASVSVEAADSEVKLLALFNMLTNNLTELSQDIEDEVSQLQDYTHDTERQLLRELESHAERLDEVGAAVSEVKLNFDNASEGAVRVGTRLSASEKERQQIETAVQLMGYIKAFESAPEGMYANVKSMNSKQLRETLPAGLKSENWGEISKVLHDLRKILTDINSEDVQNAQRNIMNIADVVEAELLGEFDIAINRLMEKPDNVDLIKITRQVAEWLHLFNGGQSLQKRYIFSVVQRRIPSDAFFTGKDNKGGGVLSRIAGQVAGLVTGDMHRDDDDSYSSAGASDNEEEEEDMIDSNFRNQNEGKADTSPVFNMNFVTSGFNILANQPNLSGSGLMDHLSGLFAMINNVCQEQFSLIRKVFPPHTIARVTRLLIQRIFNDPAFGIQARVDAILCPAPPNPPLPLADYLDALVTVREKLSALYLLLIECCSHPSMRGMGSESASLRKAKYPGTINLSGGGDGSSNRDSKRLSSSAADNEGYSELRLIGSMDDEEAEERLRSDAEIRDFFEDQISQVLAGYVGDYFDKEITHARNQYVGCLRKAVEDHTSLANSVSAGSVLQMPFLRAEKLKSIGLIVKTVANKKFLNSIFTITSDAVQRMESIGRDDKKLPLRGKELFLLQLGFLCDGLFLPWSRACNTLLLKIASSKTGNSALPPQELLLALGALTYGVSRIKSHFSEVFVRPLSAMPNVVAICQETRRNSIRQVEVVAKESLHAWTLCVAVHIEKLLASLQSKYDFQPKFDPMSGGLSFMAGGSAKPAGGLEPTVACDSVCKSLLSVANAVRGQAINLIGLDLMKLFWKPLGQQVIGALISHLRKQRVSVEGAKVLQRDLDEYANILAIMESPATMDMMACLKQICSVFSADESEVAKLVIEELRFLDTTVVLALLKARADSGVRASDHWTRVVSNTYLNQKWDAPLPWESKKHLTVLAFAESVAGGSSSALGPVTLRKSSAPLNALFINEMARSVQPQPTVLASSGGKSVQIDLGQLVEGSHDLNERSASTSSQSGGRPLSLFIPSRPDDQLTSSYSAANSPTHALNASVGGIARPDLIASKGKSSSVSGIKSPPGVGYSNVVKGPAATLLSDVNRRPSGSNGSGGDPNRRASSVTNVNGGGGQRGSTSGLSLSDKVAGEKKTAAPTSPSMFKNMTSFFTGKS